MACCLDCVRDHALGGMLSSVSGACRLDPRDLIRSASSDWESSPSQFASNLQNILSTLSSAAGIVPPSSLRKAT